MDPIPSVAENQAPAAIATLYKDIKQTLAVPTTNLVWRHLATIDNALPAIWRVLKPWYVSIELNAAAAEIRPAMVGAKISTLSKAQLLLLGIKARDHASVVAVLNNYDRTNPGNLIALCALLARLEGRELHGELPHSALSPRPVDDRQLPRLIPESEMTTATQAAAHQLNALGLNPPPSELVAGVPRHLAHWPQLLNAMLERLTQSEMQIAQAINAVQHRADYFGRIMAARLDEPAHDVDWDIVAVALRRFTAPDLIANYIVKVPLLLSIIASE